MKKRKVEPPGVAMKRMTSRTLEKLAGYTPEGNPPTGLVARCELLFRTPIDNFTPGDFRVLIGQKMGLEHLVPPALAVVEREPLVDADYYPGDLLGALLEVPLAFWSTHPQQREQLLKVVQEIEEPPKEVAERIRGFLEGAVQHGLAPDRARRSGRRISPAAGR